MRFRDERSALSAWQERSWMRRDPEGEILDALDLFFLNGGAIPVTSDGKVNVSGLTAALGLRPADAQYFHKNQSVKEAVNAVAVEQRILPIGHRVDQGRADAVVAGVIAKTVSRARADAQGSIEARHAYSALAEEHSASQLRIAELEQQLAEAKRRLAEYEMILPYHCLSAGLPRS
jgi:hypothetical protein